METEIAVRLMLALTIYAILFALIISLHEKYRFLDKNANSMWHIFKGATTVQPFLLISYYDCILDAFYAASIFWLFSDLFINIIALRVPAFYVGTTAFLDRTLGKNQIMIKLIFIISSFILIRFKDFCFIVSYIINLF